MRSLIFLFAVISCTTAWNLTLTPHGERLTNRRSGDNFLVVCKVKDYNGAASDVKVDWFRNGNKVSRLGSVMTIGTPYANQLLINRPKTSDGGSYLCKAEVDGETQELTAEISFVDPPKFVDPETEQHPEEGTTAEIKCQVEGAENLEVFWQFNGVTLDESSPRGYDFKDDKQTLVIKKYNSKKDDGIYNCNAAQYSSFETLSINVSGYSRPEITVFDIPVNGRGFEGHSAQLKCGAVGKPKPTYKWLNQEGEEIENSDKYKVEDGLLVIESLSSEDAGEYKCVASNDVGNTSQTAELSVFLKPRIERMVDITKKTNEEVEIVCRYSGEGDLKAKFVFGEQEFEVLDEIETTTADSDNNDDEDNEDTVKSAETTDAEESTTAVGEEDEDAEDENTGDDEETTTAATTEEGANDEDDEETTTAVASEEASTASDDADEEAEEEENTRWKRFVDDVQNEKVSVRADGNSLILTLRKLTLEDAGAYKCLVENEAGASNRTANLAITHAPILKSTSEELIRSFDGNTVTIYCEVSAVPEPKWIWTKDGDEVEADGTSVIIDTVGTTSRLTVENKEDNNYGNFKCTADNGIGEISHEMKIMQIVSPSSPVGLDCKVILYPNYAKCHVPEGTYENEESEPTEIEFQVAKLEDVTSNFEWEAARIIRVDYDTKGMAVPDLEPNTQYQVRAKAINEAGDSEFTEPYNMETTDPWAPKAPEDVKFECDETCTVSWTEPNDHGSEITGYIVSVTELKDNEDDEPMVPAGEPFTIDIKPEEKSVELSGIKPHSFYKISVKAVNEIGPGEPTVIEEETDEHPTSSFDSNIMLPKLLIAAGIALLFLLCLVDFICFKSNRCGLIACICLNCCGRNPADRKEKDLEAGRGETGRLLDNQAR